MSASRTPVLDPRNHMNSLPADGDKAEQISHGGLRECWNKRAESASRSPAADEMKSGQTKTKVYWNSAMGEWLGSQAVGHTDVHGY